MKSLMLVGLLSVRNFGDGVIHQSSRFLFEQAMSSGIDQFHIYEFDLQGLSYLRRKRSWLMRKPLGLMRFLRYFLLGRETSEFQDLRDYYSRKIIGTNLVIVAGGGIIKYKYEKFWLYLKALISAAECCRIPIVFNAVGIEGFDTSDRKCLGLKKAMNSRMVKVITTRDDIVTLRDLYLTNNDDVFTEKVADPAVWASEAYGVERDEQSETVGIGLIRGGIFRDNGVSFGSDKVTDLYADIIRHLSTRNIRWRIFTNGAPADTELIESIFDRLGMNSDRQILVPNSGLDLVRTISKFKGIIAARLHANIIAYSLNIPSIGLVWNRKLAMYGDNIGYPERFMEPQSCDGMTIVQSLTRAMEEGYDCAGRTRYRQTIKESARRILRTTGV